MPARLVILIFCCASAVAARPAHAAEASPPTYAQVNVVFSKHCLSCHDAREAEGGLVMESRELIVQGGDTGAAIVPGHADQSLLVRLIEHKKRPYMPPPKKADKLSDEQIALVRAWIDAGAPGPKAGEIAVAAPAIAKIEPKGAPRRPVQAMAYDPKSKLIAAAIADEVELMLADQLGAPRHLKGHRGNVNAVAFSADGNVLAAACGEPGVAGEVRLWSVRDGTLLKTLSGHKDAIYSVAISPDGKLVATGSYDQKIILWEIESAKPLHELIGHNGAVFALSFRPDGKVLASASADRTMKLWDVATGNRLDTRPESLKELHTVAFSPDGQRVAAGGVDNRIRIWRVSADASEGSNPLLVSQFAHEGAILRLAWSADGKTIVSSADDKGVKLWDSSQQTELKQVLALPSQPDWPTGLALASDDRAVVVGRLDGTIGFYDAKTAKAVAPPKPEIATLHPRGIQRGTTGRIELRGKNLVNLKSARMLDSGAAAKVTIKPVSDSSLELVVKDDLPPGSYDLAVTGLGGESGAIKLHVDDLPQVVAAPQPPNSMPAPMPVALPASVWGEFKERGDAAHVAFDAVAGEKLVLDIAARRLGSKADVLVQILDQTGRPMLSASQHFSDPDALLVFSPPTSGKYTVRIAEAQGNASSEHFYRLSIGRFAYVTGTFPLAISAGHKSAVRLVGYNLPDDAAVTMEAASEGEVDVPLDSHHYRSRRPIKMLVTSIPELSEGDHGDRPEHGVALTVPGAVSGRIGSPGESDLYSFEARSGQTYVIETVAARRGSPIDTRIEVLHPDGKPVQRVQLRAVRDSYITFRGIDADLGGARLQSWEEMQLNQLLYMQGEVVKLFLAPRGPDSEFGFYLTGGKRLCYYDTTPTAHALDEPCYIVEPHPPGEKLASTGLPVFTINYANDDASDRSIGSDSRLLFTAPTDGPFVVRVSDVRGFGGEQFTYRLLVRPAKPDFNVSVDLKDPAVAAGSGRSFTARVQRIDGFDGPVRIDLAGAPAGFTISTPLVIEAGHLEASGTLFAAADAPKPSADDASKLAATANATLDGREVKKPLAPIGRVALAPRPMLLLAMGPAIESSELDVVSHPATKPAMPSQPSAQSQPSSATPLATTSQATTRSTSTQPSLHLAQITVIPGQFVPAMLRIARNGQRGPVTFDVDNLPHGVIVADIGLNGVLIPEGQSERKIFLQCAPWVPPTSRICFARCREAGNPTSLPVEIQVIPAVSTAGR